MLRLSVLDYPCIANFRAGGGDGYTAQHGGLVHGKGFSLWAFHSSL